MGEKMDSEREAFEKWADDNDMNTSILYGEYVNDTTDSAWSAWQARAHLTQPAQAVDVGALEPHQQRVVDEKAELDARLEKLSLFKHSRTFASLPIIEQERMNTQGHLMCALSSVLGERIASFTAALPNANGREAEVERLQAELGDYRTNGASAVRFAPNSAHWSNELKRLFGEDARTGIGVLEKWHCDSQARAERADALLREALPFCDTFPDLLRDGGDELRARITAHLSENSRG